MVVLPFSEDVLLVVDPTKPLVTESCVCTAEAGCLLNVGGIADQAPRNPWPSTICRCLRRRYSMGWRLTRDGWRPEKMKPPTMASRGSPTTMMSRLASGTWLRLPKTDSPNLPRWK
jgi:hypothetical protein